MLRSLCAAAVAGALVFSPEAEAFAPPSMALGLRNPGLAGIQAASRLQGLALKDLPAVASGRDPILTGLRMAQAQGRWGGRLYDNPGAVFCPCGSGKSYQECCFPNHEKNKPPKDPTDLVRTRYSAFACGLPRYIIATTDKNSNEWQGDEDLWEKEIIEFMDRYAFQEKNGDALGVFIDSCKYFSPEVAYVQFKARMLGEGDQLVEFVERSRIEKKGSKWYYVGGTLMEHEGPLM